LLSESSGGEAHNALKNASLPMAAIKSRSMVLS
jgi:hypothetical protein